MRKFNHKCGLTLIELIIVISIILIIAGILYPLTNTFITRANEAADLANARMLYTAVCLLSTDPGSITPGSYTAEDDGSIPLLFSAYVGPDWPHPKAIGATAFQVVIRINDLKVEYEVQRIYDGSFDVFNPIGYVFQ